MKKVMVIGGGAAGMMAAIAAAKCGAKVTLVEKNEKLGKKLFITGKGRCNITNVGNVPIGAWKRERAGDERLPCEYLLDNVVNNPKFLFSAFDVVDSAFVLDFMEQMGCPIKIERGGRAFPLTDHAYDVIDALKNGLRQNHVEVLLRKKAIRIVTSRENENDEKVIGVKFDDKTSIETQAVIVATGGLSYSTTGSDGDGLLFAEDFGHTVIDPQPALVPLVIRESFCQKLMGLSLKNVKVTMFSEKKPTKPIFSQMGEMMFTHFGVTGPLILSASSFYQKYIRQQKAHGEMRLLLDLKPSLDYDTLDRRLLREFDESNHKFFKNSLQNLFPAKLIPVMIELSGISPETICGEITKNQRKAFGNLMKALQMTITGTLGFSDAIVTSGGVSVKEIDPHTCESKRVSGLYFAGEVLDVDALTGGFNLQIAWSTGYLSGQSAARI